jgi:hypothetical protein
MSNARRFPPPWSIGELETCLVVIDGAGQKSQAAGAAKVATLLALREHPMAKEKK